MKSSVLAPRRCRIHRHLARGPRQAVPDEAAAVGQEFLIKITPSQQMMGTEYFSATAGAIWGGEVNIVKQGNTLAATHGNKSFILEAVSKVGKPSWDSTRGAHLVFGSDQPIYLRLNSQRTPTEIDAALVKVKADFLASVISSDGELEEGLAAMRRVLLWPCAAYCSGTPCSTRSPVR